MLRPLLISENFPPDRGGMAQSCDRIVRGLRARDIEVDVMHLSARHAGVSVEQHERGLLLRCELTEDPGHALNLLWNALVQKKLASSHVLAFGGYAPLLAAPSFAAWLGAPLITLLRGNDFDTGIFSPRRGFVLRDALARSSAIAVVTRDHEHKVSRLFPRQNVVYVPNGIDASEWELFDFDREHAAQFRAQLSPQRRVIGLFGHLKQKKGGLFFLDALA
ncbi:MAG TPA: glycosyltransferase, partial [Polyangiales bacterium]|nr:glycosyltransferase [Polyangiales bacterium]